jgi:F0F1-type ATP synthase delta subunit
MTESVVKTNVDFKLPITVVTKLDVSRMVSEVERLDNEMTTASVRSKDDAGAVVNSVLSQQLTDFLSQNELTLQDGNTRSELITQLRILKDTVPVVHMTFAVITDPESLQKLVAWMRQSIDPRTVISVGLQPGLVAGVYVRTPNKVHDLSLRGLLNGQHDTLVKTLGELRGNR